MKGNELRKRYLEFFESKGHLILPSASMVPQDDPSLLLIGAGMAPFKAFFTGKMMPPNTRITTSQKCIRTGDLENVGRTARHHTFFEMLGNFSFGDYFKKDAIKRFRRIRVLKLIAPGNRLSVLRPARVSPCFPPRASTGRSACAGRGSSRPSLPLPATMRR